MKRLKALAALMALMLVSTLPQQSTAATLNIMEIGSSPTIEGSNFTVVISGGSFSDFLTIPQGMTASGVTLTGLQQAATFKVSSGAFGLNAVLPSSGLLLSGTLSDSAVSGNIVEALFETTDGSLASDFGSFFVLRFTRTNDFSSGPNLGAALDILPATVIPLPLGVVTLGSALGLLAAARRRRAA